MTFGNPFVIIIPKFQQTKFTRKKKPKKKSFVGIIQKRKIQTRIVHHGAGGRRNVTGAVIKDAPFCHKTGRQ